MAQKILFSIIESAAHPNFSAVYRKYGFAEVRLNSMRKAIGQLKKQLPDVVVAEFFYGYGNNYAGVNLSNLDVFLSSLQKYAPDARVIVFTEKPERQYADKLAELFPLHAILQHPIATGEFENIIKEA